MAELVRLPDIAMRALRRRERAGLPAVGQSALLGGDRIVALGPDEWLLLGPDGDERALERRAAELGGVQVDVSGNRVLFRLAGAVALDRLSAGCSYDLERLPVDGAVATLLARAQVIIVREGGDAFLILPRRSFAGYLTDWARASRG